MSSSSDAPPYWVLISVLFSSVSLTPPLALSLHQLAYSLYQHGAVEAEVNSELAMGTVRNLQKDFQLGTFSGPAFEAKIDTPQGSGTVRFLLTRQGLAWMEQQSEGASPTRPQYLN